MSDDAVCSNCGHLWSEHSKLNGCEHEPFCWCHLADPSAVKAELDEFQDKGTKEEGTQ